MPSLVLIAALLGLNLVGVADEAFRLAATAGDESAESAQRVSALSQLSRVDPKKADETARKLLVSTLPGLKLTAATIRAKAGHADGEATLLQMFADQNLELGFRGLAARRLAAVPSAKARSLIRGRANAEADLVLSGRPYPDREGFRWGLLRALGAYADPEDFETALKLYGVSGPSAPARSIGMFGRPEALNVLRDAHTRQSNAGATIEIQLAIARSGGEDGVYFIRQLLKAAAGIGALEGEIDLRTEDPLSGRLAERVLGDLGTHPSDRQFFDDAAGILRSTVCSFCGATWGALARMGTAGHEGRFLQLAEKMGRGRSEEALKVLTYNGANDYARLLGKRMGLEARAEEYISVHDAGLDRAWFPAANASWD